MKIVRPAVPTQPEKGTSLPHGRASTRRRGHGVPRAWPLRGSAHLRAELYATAGLLALGAALRLWLILRGWPLLDSDGAIVGLNARHILYYGERPVFYYGPPYMGALDAYLAAAVFRFLGPTTLALHLTILPLIVGFLALTYLLGRAAFGPAVALLTLAFLALGPAFGLLRELGIVSEYQDMLLLGAALPLLVYYRLRRPETSPAGRVEWVRCLALYAVIGLVAGLGIWSDLLILPFVAMSLLALAFVRPREMFHVPGLTLLVGMLVGCWPFLWYNLQHHWITFSVLVQQDRPAHQFGPFPVPAEWWAQTISALSVGLPAVLGSPYVCVVRGAVWGDYPPTLAAAQQQPGGACAAFNLIFSGIVLTCYAFVAYQLGRAVWRWWQARPRRPLRRGRAADLHAEQVAQRWLRAILLVAGMGTLLLYTMSRPAYTYEFTAARYLLPLYITLPLVFGVLWKVAAPARAWALHQRPRLVALWQARRTLGALARHKLAGPARRRKVGWRTAPPVVRAWAKPLRAGLAAATLIALLSFAAIGAVATGGHASDASRYALPAPPRDQQIIATLAAHGITRFVSDYWTCYRLAFESDERLRCAVRDSANNTLTLNDAVNRYLPYLVLVEHTPHPAYLFSAGSSQDTTFASWAAAQHLPHVGYARFVAAGYAVYYYPGGQG